MKFTEDRQEKYTVFTLHEENLNSIVAPNLKTRFKILHEEGTPNLVLDLSELKYVDSSGLSAILTAKRLWEQGGSFVLTGINNTSNVKKLIEISKLDSVLTIIPTVDESIDYIFMEEIERELNDDDDDD